MYQGWSNEETWQASLYLANTREVYSDTLRLAKTYADTPRILSGCLRGKINSTLIVDNKMNSVTLGGKVLQSWFDRIDFDELAEHFITLI